MAVHYAPFPQEVAAGGLLDARATGFVAFLKGACRASYSTLRTFFTDHMGVPISRGQLAKTVAKASDALAAPYDELAQRLPDEPRVNVDETGHKDPERIEKAGTSTPARERPLAWWTWAFRAGLFTLFKIVDSRGSNVLIETLGREFAGVLGSDCFPARFLGALRDLFGVIHRREEMTARAFRRALRAAKRAALKAATRRVPAHPDARTLAKRMREHGEAYFTFVTTPGVEPTNNVAEQVIRFVVIDRRITQGTRGERGRKWCERIWTVIATCAQQGRSVYRFLVDAVRAHFAGDPAPSLLPNPP